MPIWSFTQERLDRLKKQIDAKKAQHDELQWKSEKDLWCTDLDEFIQEWENQLRFDAEIQTNIRRLGRRTSKKIGAGRSRKVKDEDEYSEKKPARAPKVSAAMKAAAAAKPVEKTSQRFAEMFSAKPKAKPSSQKLAMDGADDDFSDDDFAALAKPKKGKPAAVAAAEPDSVQLSDDNMDMPAPTIAREVAGGRTKRAAATKAKKWTIDSDSESDIDIDDDEEMLGDVGAMVKGIGQEAKASATASTNGRLSLFAMSRPETSHGDSSGNSSSLPKTVRAKPSKTFDFDSHDDTNYEALALSSPRKSTRAEDLDDLVSDDEKKATSTAFANGSILAKKGRGRPVGAKTKAKEEKASSSAPLSSAAEAYAAKKAQARAALFDSDDESMGEADKPAAPKRKPAAAAPKRAARAATSTKKKPVYADQDDSDEFDMDF